MTARQEQPDEENSEKSWVEQSVDDASPATPKQNIELNDRDEEERSRRFCRLLVIAGVLLFFVTVGVVIALVFLFTNIIDDDEVVIPPNPRSPTSGPTSATLGELPLNLVDTLTGPSSYGTTTAINKEWIVVGSPSSSATGFVTAIDNNGQSTSLATPTLSSGQTGAFGTSIDVTNIDDNGSDSFLLVGAPESGSNNAGNVFLYRSEGSGSLDSTQWELQGSLTGDPTASSAPENFGASVAVSNNLVVVVGAPQHDLQGTAAGRIYIYQYTQQSDGTYQSTEQTEGQQILGQDPNSRFGEDVDVDADGNLIAVGEPGSRSFSIFNREGDTWSKAFEESNTQSTEFGSSVNFLSQNYIAVGAPAAENNRGSIHVYQVDDNDVSDWKALPVLVGKSDGDRIGAINIVNGQEGPNGPELVIGTVNGAVERYDLIGDQWIQRYSVDSADTITSISVHNTDDNYRVLVGHGGSQETLVYAKNSRISGFTPTQAPTTAAPTVTRTWKLSGGPFSSIGSENTDFGYAVALAGDFVAIGEPLGRSSQTGDVAIYDQLGSEWTLDDDGFAENAIRFGIAVDGAIVDGKPSIVVGASQTVGTNTVALGSAHYFQRDVTTGRWSAIGIPLSGVQPDSNTNEADGEFGFAVAMAAETFRFAVGAPRSDSESGAQDTGKVYIYDFNQGSWEVVGTPIVGDESNNLLGTSVDMSKDGDRILIGAPGNRDGKGGAFFYEWDGTQWNSLVTFGGVSVESLGTSVAIISEDASMIAFGGPSYENGKGIVKVYEEMQPGFFDIVGSEFIGADGEEIGTTISGANGRLCFGTSTGSFRAYKFDETSDQWIQLSNEPNLGAPVVSIHMAADGDSVVVGLSNEEVVVYEFS